MTGTIERTPGQLEHRQILTVLSGLLLGLFLAALDQNIVSVAIVPIANSLNGFDQQAWATTAYLITATISTPLYGKLADIYGRRPLYLLAIGIFVLGSAACACAATMHQLAAFRAFQGLGAGGLMSLAFTIIADLVPARERVRYQGYNTTVFGIATVLGPVLGGFFATHDTLLGLTGWRWVFLVNVPIGIVALVVVAKVLSTPHRPQRHRIDWFGAVALAFAVVPLLLVAEQGRSWGWSSPPALLCYGVGAAGTALFILVERRMRDAALIPLRLFRNRTFSAGIAGGLLIGIAMFGGLAMLPQYLQVVQGLSPTMAGLMMLPMVVGITLGSQVAGRVTRMTGRYKVFPVVGSVLVGIGGLCFAQLAHDSPLWLPLGIGGLVGIGLGTSLQTLIIAIQNAAPRADMGASTAAATFFRQIGGTLGVAAFLTVLFSLLPARILAAAGGALPAGTDPALLDVLRSDTSGIAALPEAVRTPVLIGFTEAMHPVFYTAAAVAFLAALVLLLLDEIPLREPEPVEPL
ncbi:MDR family MFS transporter [Nocardia asteroides]|uniref:MDR family MFS transporter n=1 Tax=Nocardia asteroides TaxID=1824 RepID=UPI001E59F0AE|nr:MDR family MFS transporter [Nocardia asteroides]UGT60283.1 MFS transporter [Nocardia asteroides]